MAKRPADSTEAHEPEAKQTEKAATPHQPETENICGIVMPISALDDCSEAHWSDVRSILTDAIDAAGFSANLVSDADDVGIIQKRIIQNLYGNPIVVCDVSGKNPNVMFELGMRLAFDKPTIIVKDDRTSYSFDTSPIEHLQYPRDLRFGQIVEFKAKLAEKIKNTHKEAVKNPEYTTFLKHFGEFKVAKLETKEVSGTEYILDELQRSMRLVMQKLDSTRWRDGISGGSSTPHTTLTGRSSICKAIDSHDVIVFFYDGGERTVEPYIHGLSIAGHELMRGYQIGGFSHSSEDSGWRLFEVEKMGAIARTETKFHTRPDYSRNDSKIVSIHCRIEK